MALVALPNIPLVVPNQPICLGSYVSFDARPSSFQLSTYTVLGYPLAPAYSAKWSKCAITPCSQLSNLLWAFGS